MARLNPNFMRRYRGDIHGERYLRLTALDTVTIDAFTINFNNFQDQTYYNQGFCIQWIAP